MDRTLSHLNLAESMPSNGDLLVIETKKRKGKKVLCKVKQIVDGNEIILQKSTNSYFMWDMYQSGQSWVWRVWNLGDVDLTAATNSTSDFSAY